MEWEQKRRYFETEMKMREQQKKREEENQRYVD
jgi:hypothetical protein